MEQLYSANDRNSTMSKAHLGRTRAPEAEATYEAALQLVSLIDNDLAKGIRHYRDKSGHLLTSLEEVVNAILADNLLQEPAYQEVWEVRRELAA